MYVTSVCYECGVSAEMDILHLLGIRHLLDILHLFRVSPAISNQSNAHK